MKYIILILSFTSILYCQVINNDNDFNGRSMDNENFNNITEVAINQNESTSNQLSADDFSNEFNGRQKDIVKNDNIDYFEGKYKENLKSSSEFIDSKKENLNLNNGRN